MKVTYSYLENVVNRSLSEITEKIKNSKTETEKTFYENRYIAQLNDFLEVLLHD